MGGIWENKKGWELVCFWGGTIPNPIIYPKEIGF